jgi:hypothetical protein
MVHLHITCTHPLHKVSSSYPSLAALRRSRGIPPARRLMLWPHWPPDTPGTWWWCARCRTRNASRSQAVTRMDTRMRTVKRPMPHAKRCVPVQAGERFLSVRSMHRFAHRHTPPGLAWCTRSAHYVPAAAQCRRSTHRSWCQTCWAMQFPQRKALQRLRVRKDKAGLQAVHAQLERQRGALRREIHQLRQLKTMLDREMLKRPQPPPPAALLQALAQPEEATPRPRPRRTRDRRKSFST